MAIDLQQFREASSGQQLQPTRTPVYNNPDQSTGLEGITSMFKEQERIIEQQNDSNYAIETTKYLTERQKALSEIGELVRSGQLTDVQAKEKVASYDTVQENKYKSILPKPYHTRLNTLVQTEIAKTGANIDTLYKDTKDREFVANAEITLSRAKDLDEDVANEQVNRIISDPRIPVEKKAELQNKFRNEYSTNKLDRYLSDNQSDNTALQSKLAELEAKVPEDLNNVQIPTNSILNLTPEEKTRYRDAIQNQIERNNAEAKRLEDATKREQERIQREQQALLDEYQNQVNSGYLPNPETEAAVKAFNPNAVVAAQRQIDVYQQYRVASTEERQRIRNQAQAALEKDPNGYANRGVIDALDRIDSEMDKRESESPVETYNERNPGTNLNPNDKRATALALASTNSKIIPYSSKEIQDMKISWETPSNKAGMLQAFVANTTLLKPEQQTKALIDQISAFEPNLEKAQELAVYASTLDVPVSEFDEDGKATGINRNTTLGRVLIEGQNLNINTGNLAKDLVNSSDYRDQGIDTPMERRMVINAYKYLSRDIPIKTNSNGNVVYDPEVLKRAVSLVYGEELQEDSGDPGFIGSITSLSYYNKRSGYFRNTYKNTGSRDAPTLRIPTGMTQEQAQTSIRDNMNEYARRTNTPLMRVS